MVPTSLVAVPSVGTPAAASFGPLRPADLLTQWRFDPLLTAVLLVAAAGYCWYRVRAHRAAIAWPARRDVVFAVGVLAAVWIGCGVAQARAARIEWVWMAQLLIMLLVVPFLLLAAHPVDLARRVGGARDPVARIADSRLVRGFGHPLIGPGLVPVIFAVVLFAGVGQVAASSPPAGWLLQVVLLLIGLVIALPLLDSGRAVTSLAVGLALVVGFLELIMDVFPGIALRLASHPVIGYFATHTPGWTAGWLYEQHQAGGLLWIASEVLDLPFLVLLAVRWLRVDAAEAERIDAELDSRAAPPARAALAGPVPQSAGDTPSQPDRPWFLDDPQLRDRYRF